MFWCAFGFSRSSIDPERKRIIFFFRESLCKERRRNQWMSGREVNVCRFGLQIIKCKRSYTFGKGFTDSWSEYSKLPGSFSETGNSYAGKRLKRQQIQLKIII